MFLRFSVGAALAALLAFTSHASAASQAACRYPDALGTSRVMVVGTAGGTAVGLKTYPQTLPLADHEVALTFDDGPNPPTTGRILDALARECVHATFFLVGRNAQAYPALVKRELHDGHTLGHHTWSHPEITLRGLSDAAARREIDHGILADDRAAGYADQIVDGSPVPHVPFLRFPGFADTPALRAWLAGRGIAVFGADLWASDWNRMTPQAELKLLMGRLNAAGRGIILLHDTKAQTATMLPAFLRELKKEGYRIVALEPGPGPAETRPAPADWHSETEAALAKIMPRLERAAAARRRLHAKKASATALQAPGPLLLRGSADTGTLQLH